MASPELKKSLLLIEDDPAIAKVLVHGFKNSGYSIQHAPTGSEGIAIFRRGETRAILSDLSLPDMSGTEVLTTLNPSGEKFPFIILTAFGKIDNAVFAMRAGAFNYLTKPIKFEALLREVENLFQFFGQPGEEPSPALRADSPLHGLIGDSPPMRELKRMADRLLNREINILLTGESGTGKTLLAKLLHSHGPRAKFPFISLNCGAIPEPLVESELFGHVRGAFTGALRDHVGLFQQADRGTLFLDEIGDLPLPSQVKILKVIEEGRFRPVGSERTLSADVRILSATNKNLRDLIVKGLFREDLFYRLATLQLTLPPLRDRTEDLQMLIPDFFRRKEINARLEPKAFDCLERYSWPGNIRQLENVMESALVMAGDPGLLGIEDLPAEVTAENLTPEEREGVLGLFDIEKRLILGALERNDWNQTHTARELNISRQTLIYRMKKFNLAR